MSRYILPADRCPYEPEVEEDLEPVRRREVGE